jgi:hypothetical protein
MGSKGYRLWVMGQLDSTCRAPHRVPAPPQVQLDGNQLAVAVGALEAQLGVSATKVNFGKAKL